MKQVRAKVYLTNVKGQFGGTIRGAELTEGSIIKLILREGTNVFTLFYKRLTGTVSFLDRWSLVGQVERFEKARPAMTTKAANAILWMNFIVIAKVVR